MLAWMMYWTWWFTWRAVVTVACMYTVQNVIHSEGYFIDWTTLCVATVCLIVGTRIWMPTYSKHKTLNEKSNDQTQ